MNYLFIEVYQPCLTLCDPMDYSQASVSMELSRQKYWSGYPFPSPGNLPDLETEPRSPALQADFFYHLSYQGSPVYQTICHLF